MDRGGDLRRFYDLLDRLAVETGAPQGLAADGASHVSRLPLNIVLSLEGHMSTNNDQRYVIM